jgi:hypothetical protein
MNSKLKRSGIVAASLVLAAATGQTGAADRRHGGMEAAMTVSLSRDAASSSSRLSPSRASLPEDRLAAYDTRTFADQALDGQIAPGRYAVQLYPIEQGGRVTEVASVLRSAAPAQSGASHAQKEGLSTANKALLPEPGNWAMIFAGLLGVCAIARRRMSV